MKVIDAHHHVRDQVPPGTPTRDLALVADVAASASDYGSGDKGAGSWR